MKENKRPLVKAEVIKALQSEIDRPIKADISLDVSLAELGLANMNSVPLEITRLVHVVDYLETEFDVRVSHEEFFHLKKVGDLVEVVMRKKPGSAVRRR